MQWNDGIVTTQHIPKHYIEEEEETVLILTFKQNTTRTVALFDSATTRIRDPVIWGGGSCKRRIILASSDTECVCVCVCLGFLRHVRHVHL